MSLQGKCIFILHFYFHVVLPQEIISSIQELFKDSTQPVVLLLNGEQRQDTEYDLEEKPKQETDDEGAYILYHLLRTTQESEQLDPDAARSFDITQDILRGALRARCNRLQRCVRRCVKKVYTCTVTCREEYDVYQVCETITICKTCDKRGKTMPPYWLL